MIIPTPAIPVVAAPVTMVIPMVIPTPAPVPMVIPMVVPTPATQMEITTVAIKEVQVAASVLKIQAQIRAI